MPRPVITLFAIRLTRTVSTALLFCAAIWIAAGAPAHAQVAVIVNGDPITVFDIEQRTRLERLSTQKNLTRDEVVNILIDEKLKIHIAKRYGLEISDKDVDNSFATIAQRSRITSQQFAQRLEASGVRAATLKARIRADMAWSQMIRGKFGSTLQIREKDVIDATLDSQKTDAKDTVGYEYTLRPILFVLPRGAPAAAVEAKRREADNLRARFTGCDEGIPFVRALKDVAVRDPITRNSADLSPQLRAVVDSVETGRLTPPEITPSGVEMFALCAKKETTAETPLQRQMRDQIFSKRFDEQSKRYLKELRSSAMIEYRN